MNARLKKIELGLELDRKRAASHLTGSSNSPVADPLLQGPGGGGGAQDSPGASYATDSVNLIDLPAESNPVQVIAETVDKIEDQTPGAHWAGGQAKAQKQGRTAATPEAILRGLVTLEDAGAAFGFFNERIQPHLSVLGEPEDLDPLMVHQRSAFLFHVILLVTNCEWSAWCGSDCGV